MYSTISVWDEQSFKKQEAFLGDTLFVDVTNKGGGGGGLCVCDGMKKSSNVSWFSYNHTDGGEQDSLVGTERRRIP
jgi:hypothetical protein